MVHSMSGTLDFIPAGGPSSSTPNGQSTARLSHIQTPTCQPLDIFLELRRISMSNSLSDRIFPSNQNAIFTDQQCRESLEHFATDFHCTV